MSLVCCIVYSVQHPSYLINPISCYHVHTMFDVLNTEYQFCSTPGWSVSRPLAATMTTHDGGLQHYPSIFPLCLNIDICSWGVRCKVQTAECADNVLSPHHQTARSRNLRPWLGSPHRNVGEWHRCVQTSLVTTHHRRSSSG